MDEKSCKMLLDELTSLSFLPYNEKAVEKVKENIKIVERKIDNIKESVGDGEIDEEVSMNYIMLTFYKSRCIRILRTYHLTRLLRFDNTVALGLLSKSEAKTFSKIQNLKENYLNRFNLDFKGTVPLLSYIKIVTEKDCGVVYDGEELIELKKGRIYFVKRKTVEHLLDGGFLKVIQ